MAYRPNDGDDDPETAGDRDQPAEWTTPWAYPVRIPDGLGERIAAQVAEGAHLKSAAMSAGVNPRKIYRWMAWGADADDRDASPHDSDYPYRQFFLAILTAQGLARVNAEQRAYTANPTWWLTRHPDARGDWGSDEQSTAFPDTVIEVEAPQPIAPPTASPEKLRTIVQMLHDAGVLNTPVDGTPDANAS